jgi:hypothetical protein
MDPVLSIYYEVVAEYKADLLRQLEMRLAARSDAHALSTITNEFIAEQIASLKALSLDLDIRLSRLNSRSIPAALDNAASAITMPVVYGPATTITMGSSIATYGLYITENWGTNPFRWSGPTTAFGFIAHLNRDTDMHGSVRILTRIAESVLIQEVRIDGSPVPSAWHEHPMRCDFVLPRRDGLEPLLQPTLISFKLNEVLPPSAKDPASTDHRPLGIGLQSISLHHGLGPFATS